jgi:hypothetical protein
VSNIRDSALNRIRAADLARQHARQAILGTVRETGGRTVTRPVFRDRLDLDMTLTDAEAIAALQASAAIAHALRNLSNRMRHQAARVVCGEVLVSMVAGGSLIQTLAGRVFGCGQPLRNRSGCAW